MKTLSIPVFSDVKKHITDKSEKKKKKKKKKKKRKKKEKNVLLILTASTESDGKNIDNYSPETTMMWMHLITVSMHYTTIING